MAAIYDMTRRVTMHDVEGDIKAKMDQIEAAADEELIATKKTVRQSLLVNRRFTLRGKCRQTIDKLPDKVLQQIFSYLSPYQILQSGQVCKRWRAVACSPMLWKFVSFRPNYGGIQVTNHDYFLHLIGTQFSELRIVELTTDLITPNVLYEMANKCPRLQHLTLGTYEKVEDEEEEVYETVNVFKLKQFLPNLRVVNLWGVPFITDEHVDAISSNCAHLECLCVNYCTKVNGSCLKLVLQRCRKLKSLFLAHTTLDNSTIKAIEWEKTRIEELDVKGTELSSDTLISLLTRLPHLRWLDASWLESMTDQVMEAWMQSGALGNLQYINLDTCDSLNEASLTELIVRHGPQLYGLCLGGQHKLLEYFWMNMIPQLKNIRVIVMGIAEDCCAKVAAKIHIDQFIDCIAQNCPRLTRLEIRWDDDTLRFSDKSRRYLLIPSFLLEGERQCRKVPLLI
ncbi:F-box domain protein [Ancylostoma ceylanicum]|uniref:F-box domain protein n=1 Tax=Ancylostoma ceylanicum TaxID=53326 RepID=A0A0D6L7B3_9BILA|nr:F-box domain protein [Ancylostoma ceylanicum]